jgi:uncharacterized protein YwgA
MKYEYDLFISYSSKDAKDVISLCNVLRDKGYKIWLDEWEIQVGEHILNKIEDGLNSSRFLAVWLSNNSIESNFVKREWLIKCWDEFNSNITTLLPLLGQECEIPSLLKGKKYADFSHSFNKGLEDLLKVISCNSSVLNTFCIQGIIKGIDAKVCAENLARIAIRNNDEDAILGIWTAANETIKPIISVDPCAYYIGKIIIETTNNKIEEIGFNIINESTTSNSKLIIDKFAYTAGQVVLLTNNTIRRNKMIDFIDKCANSTNGFVKSKYNYTKNRIIETENN